MMLELTVYIYYTIRNKQQLAVNTTQTIASEQKIVQQAVQLDKRKVSIRKPGSQ